ncbi:hypothetical protein HZA98_03080 [Candidatus Woesearchaeota archaeon]|nr:hypothetical protein [Candidatus Woesearchaeota archaeon]
MIIIRYREIGLKGKNRVDFERQLQKNIKDCLKKNNIPFDHVLRIRGRLLIETNQECPQLTKVFGIASFSYAEECSLDLETIKKQALKNYSKGTFRITCQRMETFPLTSTETEQAVGAYIVEKTNAKVKLKDPDKNIQIEIFNKQAYIFSEKISGPGGLPIGAEAHAVLYMQDKNSVKAGLAMMKRACSLNIYNPDKKDYAGLKEYEYGFRIKELNEIPNNTAIIVSDTLSTIKEYPYFVLRPLIGIL